MSHGGQENQMIGLRDVFHILLKAPRERLLSLTFQLGESPEDNIVHALCLIILRKEERALDRLQMLKDNHLAKHLAEKWQMSAGKLEDFAIHCGDFQQETAESLVELAKIFNVLSEHRLCDPLLKNQAFKRAVDLEYEHFRRTTISLSGLSAAEILDNSPSCKAEVYHEIHNKLDEGNTLKVTLCDDQTEDLHSLPSPLQASSSLPSYPTHLEISLPPTASFQDDRVTPETSDPSGSKSQLNAPTLLVSEGETENAPVRSRPPVEPQPKSSEPQCGEKELLKTGEALATKSRNSSSLIAQNETLTHTTKPTSAPNFALPFASNVVLPKMPAANEVHESSSAEEEEEEEAVFYAFVILHAPEDTDKAENIKERLEKITGSVGATFSEDFSIAGKSVLKCVEDAINNSAFTLLLLSRNFNTRLLDMKTDSALINSINKEHKVNTVIPLLPQENSIPRHSIPMALQTLVPLEESRNFERKALRSLSPARIKRQKTIWTQEQEVKRQIQRQESLKHLNRHQRDLIQGYKNVQLLEKELISLKKLHLSTEEDADDGRARWQRQPNIHIENANYIMIGNESQMTVGRGAEQDDTIYIQEEQ